MEQSIWEQLAAPFTDADLEWKPQTLGKSAKGVYARLVPYVQSRAIMERLDKVLTPAGWKDEYRPVVINESEGFICRLSVRDEKGEWVFKEDGAPGSDIEALKGGLSNALKRTAVKFGVGRDLYALGEFWARGIVELGHGEYPPDEPDVIKLWQRAKDGKPEINAWCRAPKIAPVKDGGSEPMPGHEQVAKGKLTIAQIKALKPGEKMTHLMRGTKAELVAFAAKQLVVVFPNNRQSADQFFKAMLEKDVITNSELGENTQSEIARFICELWAQEKGVRNAA